MRFRIALLLGAAFLSGCTSVDVKQFDAAQNLVKLVCIQRNPQVIVGDFLGVVEDAFQRRGIGTKIYEAEPPPVCEYMLTYIATQKWDFAPFLSHAEIRIRNRNDQIVASAIYHHSGGLALNKWESTDAKMTPVLDELLAGFGEPEASKAEHCKKLGGTLSDNECVRPGEVRP